jgi:predicted glycogen debranching enzyme
VVATGKVAWDEVSVIESNHSPAQSNPSSEGAGLILDVPHVFFGREICGDLAASLRREWLVTNGLGGYASATLGGILTRSYHGLLVAALEPPVARSVLVAGLVEWASYAGRRYPLSTHEFAGGTITPDGYRYLESFRLDGALPVWTFAFADALLERRIWMEYGENTTYVRYQLLRGSEPLDIELTPLVTYRSFHALDSGQDRSITVDAAERGAVVHFGEGTVPVYMSSDRASFHPSEAWWWDFHHREETSRGLADSGALYAIGSFAARMYPGEAITLVASTEAGPIREAEAVLASAHARQAQLLRVADAEASSPVVQQLVLAADQVIVSRPLPDNANGRSVIAGYHWFNDWGRDTMIALPGLFLATGRFAEAESTLRTFAAYLDRGLLPNNFPDRDGMVPGYNTADATLWYVLAMHAYVQATGDDKLITDLLPTLIAIVDHHLAGTHYHIGVDPDDGLLYAGEPGVQLTWMDAKVGDWVVTPRIGKPVEINALWYNALQIVADALASHGDDATAVRYQKLADHARGSFLNRFGRAGIDHLADVVDGPDGDDWTVRPNQLFALSLPFPLLANGEARTLLAAISRDLSTSYGLRSLAQDDPAYRGSYGGDQLQRDGAYHQGPVWSWLLGAYAEAMFRMTGDRAEALRILLPIADHLRDAGLGSVSEIFEGDPPHLPRGCVAQAWGIAEILRVWRLLETD